MIDVNNDDLYNYENGTITEIKLISPVSEKIYQNLYGKYRK